MNKKNIVYLIVITILLIVIFAIINRCSRNFVNSTNYDAETTVIETLKPTSYEYSLEEPPIKYGVDKSKEAKTRYFEYLKQYIKPIKLSYFIKERDLYEGFYNKNGNRMVNMLKYCGYRNLFESMFDINRIGFNDCPVSNKFLEKFNANIVNYFNIYGEEIYLRSLKEEEKKIEIEARWNITLDGEAEYAMLYRFKYTLDEEGNVDDIILEHIGWD